jgi:hypothetical protein
VKIIETQKKSVLPYLNFHTFGIEIYSSLILDMSAYSDPRAQFELLLVGLIHGWITNGPAFFEYDLSPSYSIQMKIRWLICWMIQTSKEELDSLYQQMTKRDSCR